MMDDFDENASAFSKNLMALIDQVVARNVGPLRSRIDKLEHAKSALQKTLAGLERKLAERE